jgi:hypothetical protein
MPEDTWLRVKSPPRALCVGFGRDHDLVNWELCRNFFGRHRVAKLRLLQVDPARRPRRRRTCSV